MNADGPAGLPADPAQGSPRGGGEQGHPSPAGGRFTVADALTLSRLPLALAFLLVGDDLVRLSVGIEAIDDLRADLAAALSPA